MIRSSWIVENGFARPVGSAPEAYTSGYHCSGCGLAGHSKRTCGKTPEERRRGRRGL